MMKIKAGDTLLCKLERKNSLTPIGVKGTMMISKDNVKIRTRNSTDWKLLENGCRESLSCDYSDNEGAFESADAVPVDRSSELWQGQEQPGENSGTVEEKLNKNKDMRPVTGPEGKITSTKDTN